MGVKNIFKSKIRKKKITISIVAYNNYNKIIQVVNLVNTYAKKLSKEIMIIDNSSHKEKKNIEKLKSIDEVKYIDAKKNLGYGKANNLAYDQASDSDYFAVINPDILLEEDSFSKIVKYLDNNPETGAVIPKIIDSDNKILPVYRRNLTLANVITRYINPFGIFDNFNKFNIMQDHDFNQVFQVPFGQGSFLVIRSSIFKKINGFDERYFMYLEDADLCRKINEVSKLEYFPYTEVTHQWQKGSHKSFKLMFIHFRSMYKYFKKWRGPWY